MSGSDQLILILARRFKLSKSRIKSMFNFVEPIVPGVACFPMNKRKSELRLNDEVEIVSGSRKQLISVRGKIVLFSKGMGTRSGDDRKVAIRVKDSTRPIIIAIRHLVLVKKEEIDAASTTK